MRYIEYENNGDRTKILSFKEYLEEINSFLKDIINNLRKSISDYMKINYMVNSISDSS